MLKSILWRWSSRLKLVVASLFVCVVSTQSWTSTTRMGPVLYSCHESCFACKNANGEWRAGDTSRNENCKACNDCYQNNAETILNYRRKIHVPQKTAEGHFDKFIMISNEESVYPEGCPRPPACPEDYPWEVLRSCPALRPCGQKRRALNTKNPTEDQAPTVDGHNGVMVKPYSPISRPTVAWPTTAVINTATGTTTSAMTSDSGSTTATKTTPPTTEDPMKLLRIQRKATLKSKIFPDGNIFLLKQVAKNSPYSVRPPLQFSYPNRPLLPETLKHKVVGVRMGKRVERQGETTPVPDLVDPNFFADNNDDEQPNGEEEHAFRPNEFHSIMKNIEYNPSNVTNEEDSADETEAKLGSSPKPRPMAKANSNALKKPVIVSQADKTDPVTVSKLVASSEPFKMLDSPTSHPEYVDYVTFPPSYSENTPPVVPNCCPNCFCSMPMCMMGVCPFGAPQNNVYSPGQVPSFPQYLEVDEGFAKTARKPSPRDETSSTKVPNHRRGNRNRRGQILYFGFRNS